MMFVDEIKQFEKGHLKIIFFMSHLILTLFFGVVLYNSLENTHSNYLINRMRK